MQCLAIEVMRSAVEGAYRQLPPDRPDRTSGRNGTYPASSVRVLSAGLWSDAPHEIKPEEAEAAAGRFAAALGVEIGSFSGKGASNADVGFPYTDEDVDIFVAASVPEIRGSEVHVEVRRWVVIPGLGYALNIYKVDLERRRKKGEVSWQVARVSDPINLDYY